MKLWKLFIPVLIGLGMAFIAGVAMAAPEGAQISHDCTFKVGENAYRQNFVVTFQSDVSLAGTTGVLTGVNSSGVQFTVPLVYTSDMGGNKFVGSVILPSGTFTIVAGTVGFNVHLVQVHNVPFVFQSTKGYSCDPTAVTLDKFSASSAAALSEGDHITPYVTVAALLMGMLAFILAGYWAWAGTHRRRRG